MNYILQAENVSYGNMLSYPPIGLKSKSTTFFSGNSGCGKTTLFKLFNGTVSPDKGQIYYCGRDISQLDTIALRKDILLAGQSAYLFDGTIRDNFAEFYAYRDLPAPADDIMQKFLQLCCADFELNISCTSMSGGEKQRVYLAICISFMPKILMLDEPTSALDTDNAKSLMANLKQFSRENNITPLIISHDKHLIEQFADELVVLHRSDSCKM